MDRLLGTYTPYLYALMRIVLGVLFACHGAQKLFGILGGEPVALFSLRGLAGIIEFVGGLLVSVVQVRRVPSGPLTSNLRKQCGLAQTHSVTTPSRTSVFPVSNVAAP